MATYLDAILERHRSAAAADDRDLGALRAAAQGHEPRGFLAALAANPAHLGVIAEVKRRSPSKGALNEDLDPAVLARDYEAGGARCLSVLTDGPGFGGSAEDLAMARQACSLPVLRKDFTVCERDVLDAAAMGADAILLIAAALSHEELSSFAVLAEELGLDVLLELHDEADLAALEVHPWKLVGVNRRNLATFEVDDERAISLLPLLPAGATLVAESGVHGPADAAALATAGFHAVLVGETLVRAGDPRSAVAELAQVAR